MLDARATRGKLLIAVAVIASLGLVAEAWHMRTTDAVAAAVLPKLSLSFEGNLPTWFASSLLLACAIAAGSIARARPAWHRHWWAMAAVATCMSIDEAAELHEHLGGHLELAGVLYFDWVIPAALLVAVLGLAFLPFIRAVHPPTRIRLVIAAVVYVGGALVIELPLGWWTEQHGTDGFGYALIDWVEETLELVGATLALTALLAHRQETA